MPAVAHTRCGACRALIPVAVTSDPAHRPGEPITLVLDETDLWVHAHEEQADREG